MVVNLIATSMVSEKYSVSSKCLMGTVFFRVDALPSGRGGGGGGGGCSESRSCFDEAENRAASSLWAGATSYAGFLGLSKPLWVWSHLKSDFYSEKNLLKSI